MKKILSILLSFITIFSVCSCSCKKEKDNKIEYKHYARGGGTENLKADILWEYANETYTKYQVAYTSYVCSDTSVNYINVIYLEITNRDSKKDSKIRNISFTTVEGPNNVEFNVGLWGDYKSSVGKDFYEGIENSLLPNLKYLTHEQIKEIFEKGNKGYNAIDNVDSDALIGGTVSANNIISIVKAIFDYHIEKYY